MSEKKTLAQKIDKHDQVLRDEIMQAINKFNVATGCNLTQINVMYESNGTVYIANEIDTAFVCSHKHMDPDRITPPDWRDI